MWTHRIAYLADHIYITCTDALDAGASIALVGCSCLKDVKFCLVKLAVGNVLHNGLVAAVLCVQEKHNLAGLQSK
jgi:hypothetical protein